MKMSSKLLYVLVVGILGMSLWTPCVACAEEKPAPPPSKEKMATWIKNLGNEDFQKRNEAKSLLTKAGTLLAGYRL